MASPVSHAVAAIGIAACFYKPEVAKRLWACGIAVAVAPDLDVIGFRFGIHYGDLLGHRGLTHSLLFAAALATVVRWLAVPKRMAGLSRGRAWLFLFLAAASHGILDAMTNGGMGVALLSPLDTTRYFLPWRPIQVSPISFRRFFSDQGVRVLGTELIWIWIPAALCVLAAARRLHTRPSARATA